MKNLLLLLFLLVSSQIIAQKNKVSISIGPTFAFPIDDAKSKYFKTGIGAGLRMYYPVSKNGSFMANINYLKFPHTANYSTSFSNTSFKMGYKNFIAKSLIFIYGDAGIVWEKTISNPDFSKNLTLGLGFGLGYSLVLSKRSFIDISPGLNYSLESFGRKLVPQINISYRFNLHKR